MPVGDVVFLAFIVLSVGWVAIAAVRSNRRARGDRWFVHDTAASDVRHAITSRRDRATRALDDENVWTIQVAC